MRSKEEIKHIIDNAKEFGLSQVEVDGVKYTISPSAAVSNQPMTSTPFSHTQVQTSGYIQHVQSTGPVPEMKPEDIVKPLSVFDDLTDDEILYYSSPYYDELQAKKEAQKQLKKESDELKEAANG
jgi:hypothetical protein